MCQTVMLASRALLTPRQRDISQACHRDCWPEYLSPWITSEKYCMSVKMARHCDCWCQESVSRSKLRKKMLLLLPMFGKKWYRHQGVTKVNIVTGEMRKYDRRGRESFVPWQFALEKTSVKHVTVTDHVRKIFFLLLMMSKTVGPWRWRHRNVIVYQNFRIRYSCQIMCHGDLWRQTRTSRCFLKSDESVTVTWTSESVVTPYLTSSSSRKLVLCSVCWAV